MPLLHRCTLANEATCDHRCMCAAPVPDPATDGTRAAGARSSGFRLSDYRYELPPELIAQAPLPERSASRLLVVDGARREHRSITDLPALLEPGDHLVFNDTRVVPARLRGRKASGGQTELMLERLLSDGRAQVKLRASKSPKPGARLLFGVAAERAAAASPDAPLPSTAPEKGEGERAGASPGASAPPLSSGAAAGASLALDVIGREGDLFEVAGASADDELGAYLDAHGEIPLPPYIERAPDAEDALRYQTVYAREPGAVAAPTAGLHFDEALLDALAARGLTRSHVTLHVGAGTFQPVRVDDPAEHVMHAERLVVTSETVEAVAAARERGGRVVAVGTTAVRALESAAAANGGTLAPHVGETRLFLTPGSPFHVVDALLTNFHLPESTLLMLVAAFAGLDRTLAAYREAVADRYRFFSYGDAMLVWPHAHRRHGGSTAALVTAAEERAGVATSIDGENS